MVEQQEHEASQLRAYPGATGRRRVAFPRCQMRRALQHAPQTAGSPAAARTSLLDQTTSGMHGKIDSVRAKELETHQ
jgi:hypothetical protein